MKAFDPTGRPCKTCNHPRRAEIELRLANGTPIRIIADKYGLTKDSLYNHRKKHMPAELINQLRTGRTSAADLEQLKQTESEGLLQQLVHERARQQRIADKAEALDDFANATRASVAALKSSELIAKLLGDIETGRKTVNITVMPEFHAFRTAIIQALRPYHDAKLAVMAQLQLLEHEEVIEGECTDTPSA